MTKHSAMAFAGCPRCHQQWTLWPTAAGLEADRGLLVDKMGPGPDATFDVGGSGAEVDRGVRVFVVDQLHAFGIGVTMA